MSDIQSSLEQFRTDMGLTHDWVQGTDTATVTLGGVATPTIRNAIRQFLGSGGITAYATKALLDADLTPAANSLAVVTNDATAANNGYYVKSGASGSGSWTASDYDPATNEDFAELAQAVDRDFAELPYVPLFVSPDYPDLRAAVIDEDARILMRCDADGTCVRLVTEEDEAHGFMAPWAPKTRLRIEDEEGREAVRLDDGGGLFSAGWARAPMPYVEDGALRAVVDGADVPLARFSDAEVLAASPLNGQAVRVAVRKDSGEVLAGAVGTDGVALPVQDDKTLHVFLQTGQSLAAGTQGTALETLELPTNELALMFVNSGSIQDIRMGTYGDSSSDHAVDPDDLIGFQPVRAALDSGGTHGQTPMEGLAQAVAMHEMDAGLNYRTLWIVSACGSRSYNQLKKGTRIYNNAIAGITAAKRLADERGWGCVVDGIFLKHGEMDADNGSTTYFANLLQWQSDYDEDIKAITGQSKDIPFFIGAFQTWLDAASNSGKDGHGPITAMLRAHAEHPGKFRIVSNDYPILPYYTPDNRHYTGKGYAILGEMWARTAMQAAYFGGCECVRVIEASRSAKKVTLHVTVPVAPLAIDTTQVTERSGTKCGIRFFKGGTEIAVSAVSVTDTGASGIGTLTLTLASSPSGDGEETVQIAWDGMASPRKSATVDNIATMPRANIRDSAGDRHRSRICGMRLDNWIVPQSITIS